MIGILPLGCLTFSSQVSSPIHISFHVYFVSYLNTHISSVVCIFLSFLLSAFYMEVFIQIIRSNGVKKLVRYIHIGANDDDSSVVYPGYHKYTIYVFLNKFGINSLARYFSLKVMLKKPTEFLFLLS